MVISITTDFVVFKIEFHELYVNSLCAYIGSIHYTPILDSDWRSI